MARVKDEDIALVRDRTSIADIINETVTLKSAGGGNLKGLCPFHDEKTPSFTVSPARNVYFCLAGETRVITDQGIREIRDLAGGRHRVITTHGRFVEAPFQSFGEQPLLHLRLSRNGQKKTIRATAEHRWFIRVRTDKGEKRVERVTSELRVGDRLSHVFPRALVTRDGGPRLALSPFGVARGIVFGDGTVLDKGSVAFLYGGKDRELLKWFPLSDTYESSGRLTVTGMPAYFKTELPPLTESLAYLYGWLAGYFAADGDVAADGCISLNSANREHLEYVRDLCTRIGVGTYGIEERASATGDGLGYRLSLMGDDLAEEFFLIDSHRDRFVSSRQRVERRGWVVEAIEDHGEVEEVFCAIVDGTHAFVLEDNILTGNCHGCGMGGDAIKFLMDAEHLSFIESVERLASRAGLQLRYDESPGDRNGAPRPQPGQRQRLIAAHHAATQFYREQLTTPGARIAREFLAQRGFGREAAERYGCGFAPDGWDLLTKHLRLKGFTDAELTAGGLSKPAKSGSLIDRFRRRLIWPIRDLTGDVIGFGARRLFDDDDGPKYLNTPESPLYKKSHVLYGIDFAKREIAKQSQAVIVEGYTDVMACHEAGVHTAVATCGTAFGTDHIGVLRRLLMDSDSVSGEIIYTFDGDAAGQKAALRAFEEDQRFVGRTFIAVSPDNMDPCDLRLAKGDLAVRDLVARREPLVDFALRQTLSRFDLDTVEGRVEAMRRAAPLVAKIKDREKRPEYARKLAGDLGMDLDPVLRAVNNAYTPEQSAPAQRQAPDSPQRLVEREALKLALQYPVLAGPMFDALGTESYADPVLQGIRQAIAEAGGTTTAAGGAGWIESVRDLCADLSGKALIGQLSVDPPRVDGEVDPRYVSTVLATLQVGAVATRIRDLKSKVQRINPVAHKDEYLAMAGELFSLEQHARALREQAAGGL
ncbi:DNA primase [Actinoplanes sp. NPDC089786]|uniref:DNA primase n=1 Tax=Actinoplanes sp. NPDC089786 TaxID=3155185 RepID=UPI00341C066D